MSVSRKSSGSIMAASLLLLSSTAYISPALAVDVFTGGVLNLEPGKSIDTPFDLSDYATINYEGNLVSTLAGSITNNRYIIIFNISGPVKITGNIDGSAIHTSQRGTGSLTIDGVINASESFSIGVEGTLVLNSANNFGRSTKSIMLSNGTLVAGNNNAFSNTTISINRHSTLSANKDVSLTNEFQMINDSDFSVDTAGHDIILTGKIDSNIGDDTGGKLVKNGAGTLTLNADNTYSGGTTLNEGTLKVSADSNLGNVNGGLTFDGGTLELSSSFDLAASRAITLEDGGGTINVAGNNITITNAISGEGTLTVDNSGFDTDSGLLVLTGDNTFIGRVSVSPDASLQIGDAGTTGSIVADLLNNGTVTFNRSDAVTYDGTIGGNGELIKEGANTLTVTGDSSDYAGSTTVKSGKLIVGNKLGNGNLGGNVTIYDGATLGGYGKLGSGESSLVNIQSGGILSPGNSIGTLTVNGDLTLQPGSHLMADLAGDSSADLIHVTGSANISGSHLVITALDPEISYQGGQIYTILSADHSISGDFADVTSNSAFLSFTPDMDQSSNSYKIVLTPNSNDQEDEAAAALFSRVASTNNEFATAQALDSLAQNGSSLALYNKLLMLSAEEARSAYNRLSGEAYASAKTALINQSHFINGAIINRLQQANGSISTAPVATMNYVSEPRTAEAFEAVTPQVDTANLYTGWAYAYGAWSEQDATASTGRLKSSVGGFVTGIDRIVHDNWRLGFLAGYSHTSFDAESRASSGSSDNYTFGAYTGTEWQMPNNNALGFSAGLAYTWHQIDMNRSVAFPAFSDNLNADYDAGTFQIFGELGYKIRSSKAVFEPYANLSYVRLNTDGFDEKGQTAAALSMQSDATNTTFSTLGVRASTGFELGTIPTTLRADLGWRHAAGDINPVSTSSFTKSNAFTVAGAPIAKNSAIIEAGLDFALSKDATFGMSYSGQFGSGAQRNGFNAALKVSF